MLVLSSGWLPGAGKHVLGLFSVLSPAQCPSITPVGLLWVCLDQGSLTKSSCLPRAGGAQAWGGSRGACRSFFKEFLSCQPWLSLPKPAAKPGVTFKKSGPELGACSGFMVKASSKMFPRRKSWVKCSFSLMCWITAGVSATGMLLHFKEASPKK